jgi:hypothetical protein
MAPVRFPVHHVDRFFLLFEGRPPPVTCAWVFAVEGAEPAAERLRAAAVQALRAHPKAAARLRTQGGRWEWEVLDDVPGRAFVVEGALAGSDEERAEAERLQLIMGAPLDAAEGPLARVHWIPPGAHAGRLVLRFHHALADATGSLMLLRSLLEAYDGDAAPAVASAGTAPVAPPPPPPLVSGGLGYKLGLLGRLIRLHIRHSVPQRMALPETLFGPDARPAGGLGSARRRVPAEGRQRLLTAVRAAGAGIPHLLIAASVLAAERALAEQGRRCGMLRVQVTRDLRRRGAEPAGLENHSSAFPVWIGAAERAHGPELVRLVRRQVREALRAHAAEGTALFAAALRLPMPLARALLLPAATRPRIADSLVFTWLGALPASAPAAGWFRLGRGRFVGARLLMRPPEGVGAILAGVEIDGHIDLTLNYLTGLFTPSEADRYLDLLAAALEELARTLSAG